MGNTGSYRAHGTTAVFLSVAVLLIFWLPDFFGYSRAQLSFWLPVTGQWYDGALFASNGYRLLTIVLSLVNGLALYVFGQRFLALGRSGHLMVWFYLLFIFAYPQARAFSFVFLSTLLAIAGLFALFISTQAKDRVAPLFMAALCTTCAGLLYWPCFIMVAAVAVAAAVLHIFSLRRGLIFLGGILLPLGGLVFYRFIVYEDALILTGALFDMFGQVHPQLTPGTPAALFLMLVLTYLLLRSIWRMLTLTDGANILRSRALVSIILMLLFCSLTALLYARMIYGFLPLLALPVSACLTCYFSSEKMNPRMKAEFYVLLLALLINQFASLM